MRPRRCSRGSPSPERPRRRLEALFRRARPGADGWARPGRRTIYILPTREGLLLAPVLAATALTGLHYNNNAALGVTFLLVGLALVAAVHTWRELAGLALRARSAGEAFAGGRQRFRVSLRGEGRTRRLRLRVPGTTGTGVETVAPAEGTGEVLLALDAPRRGRLRLEALRVETDRPFGLFRAWTVVDTEAAAWIYPAPAAPAPLPAPAAGTGAGDDAAGGVEDPSGAFHDLAPYRPGESPRRVHWRLAARGRGLHVRRFAAAATGELVLAWDAAPGPAERRLSLLCRWVLEASRRGLVYGLVLPGRHVPAGNGPAHRRRCLEALARWPR